MIVYSMAQGALYDFHMGNGVTKRAYSDDFHILDLAI
jgi:hypothetical protein